MKTIAEFIGELRAIEKELLETINSHPQKNNALIGKAYYEYEYADNIPHAPNFEAHIQFLNHLENFKK